MVCLPTDVKRAAGGVTLEWALTASVALVIVLASLQYVQRVRLAFALEDAAAAAARVLVVKRNVCLAWVAAVVQLSPTLDGSENIPLPNLPNHHVANFTSILRRAWRAAGATSLVLYATAVTRQIDLGTLPTDLAAPICKTPPQADWFQVEILARPTAGVFLPFSTPETAVASLMLASLP